MIQMHTTVLQTEETGELGRTSECFHSLLSSLSLTASDTDRRLRTIGFTSCLPSEGVSTIAINTAVAASSVNDQRVLLVDGNWNNPSLDRSFDLCASPGLAECLHSNVDPRPWIQATRFRNLSALVAGECVTDPYVGCGSTHQLSELIESVTAMFDTVIFDVAPVGDSDVAMPLLSSLDGIVLVVEADRVSRHLAQRVVQRFERAGVRLLGIALNKPRRLPKWISRMN
ncbi:MAG: CpsD/CapB family tyrosine-protein kinase [Pirellulaceae bacterium]|nr:tyrosine-protein kinase family protein [Planctomycetaceae bacterium]